MTCPSLIVGPVTVPFEAAAGLTLQSERLGGRTDLRMSSGRLVSQCHWQKWRAVLSGDGRLPPGLALLEDTDPPHFDFRSPVPRAVPGAGPAITLPTGARSDANAEPYARAIVGHQFQPTPVALAGATATVGLVPGAAFYQVFYFPQFTAAVRYRETTDTRTGLVRWQLTAEEI